MGEMITKPDANPILLAVLNFFLWGGIGYLLMGQKKKGIIAIVVTWISWMFCLGWVPQLIFAYDAYLLGQRLQQGESIGETENGLDFLNAIFK